jgi:hypothetical protein
MADSFGYHTFFVITSTIGIPIALLSFIVWQASRGWRVGACPQIPVQAGDWGSQR